MTLFLGILNSTQDKLMANDNPINVAEMIQYIAKDSMKRSSCNVPADIPTFKA